jgi:hypothetical protein
LHLVFLVDCVHEELAKLGVEYRSKDVHR